MSQETYDEGVLRRYLLGTSDQSEQTLVEERLLRDTKFYQELLISEDEVIDEYLTNELSAVEKDHFEKNFLVTPERLQRVRFARSLSKYIQEAADTQPVASLDQEASEPSRSRSLFGFLAIQNPLARYAFVAIILLAIGGSVWFALRSTQTTIPSGQNVMAVTLTPGLTRGSGQTLIKLSRDFEILQLRLALPADEYQSYQAELVREGRTVLVKEDLKPEMTTGKFLILNLDPRDLRAGDYQVRVSGNLPNQPSERLQGYQFRILSDDSVK
jgi:hypothetical protein